VSGLRLALAGRRRLALADQLGQQPGERAPAHLGRAEAEEPLGGPVEGLDRALLVDHDHALGGGVHHRAHVGLVVAQAAEDAPQRLRQVADLVGRDRTQLLARFLHGHGSRA